METWRCVLPFPPSLNRLYENARRVTAKGKVYNAKMVSAEGVRFRELVVAAVRRGHRAPPKLRGLLKVTVFALPPDVKSDGSKNRARRDDDNLWKALNDALTRAGVIADDSLFRDSRIVRGNPVGAGCVLVCIEAFDPDGALLRMNTIFAAELAALEGSRTADLPF